MDYINVLAAFALGLAIFSGLGSILLIAGALMDRRDDEPDIQQDDFTASITDWGNLRDGGRLE